MPTNNKEGKKKLWIDSIYRVLMGKVYVFRCFRCQKDFNVKPNFVKHLLNYGNCPHCKEQSIVRGLYCNNFIYQNTLTQHNEQNQ